MKKKFFATLALFASLALTACGGGTNQSNNASTKHNHDFGDVVTVKEATCEEAGETKQVCKICGYEKTGTIKALGHDYDAGVVTKEATCSVPGEKTFTCSRCHKTTTEEIKADHVWGEATPVAGAESEAAYNLFTCTVCGAKKIEFAAKQAAGKYALTSKSGNFKSDSTFPDYMKLNDNDDYVEYTFQSTIGGNAKIYQRGVMDYWHDGNNENQARNYFSGKNGSSGNFELKVNDAAVDYAWSSDLTYEDMLPGDAQGSYSPLGDALIGDCTINAGANTVRYTRKDSYNMLIKDFVIVIEAAQA